MIIFASTKKGYSELESLVLSSKYPVWIGKGVLSDEEMSLVREKGVNLTHFNHEIDVRNELELRGALQTIAEHHPGERVWLECQPAI